MSRRKIIDRSLSYDQRMAEAYFGDLRPLRWEQLYGPPPTEPIPARESTTGLGYRRYVAPQLPTAILFDWLLDDGISPWTLAEVHGISVKWKRPYQSALLIDRVCCLAGRVHPAKVYGMGWALLADWELDLLDADEAVAA